MRAIILLLIVCALLVGCSTQAPSGVTGEECTLLGGEIVNTLSQETCGEGFAALEIVPDADGSQPQCPCICCVPEGVRE